MKKKTPENKEKNRKPTSKFTTTKKLSTGGKWLEIRFNDLIKIIKKKGRVAKDTGKFSLTLDKAEFESIIDGLERGKKNGFLLDENKKLHVEINNLDTKLDDKALNELLAIEWAKEAIPGKDVKLEHCKVALHRIGIKTPGKGPPKKRDPIEVLEFHNKAICKQKEINPGKELTTEQKEKAVKAVLSCPPFKFPSYDATRKYLTRNKADDLPWGV